MKLTKRQRRILDACHCDPVRKAAGQWWRIHEGMYSGFDASDQEVRELIDLGFLQVQEAWITEAGRAALKEKP